jgi:hypothetical protein
MAVVFLVAWRWLSPAQAAPIALLATGVMVLADPAGQLINPSVQIFPDVLAASLLLMCGLTGRLRFLMGGAVAAGTATNFHVSAIPLVSSVLLVGALGSRRPVRDCAAAVVVAVLAAVVTSWDTWFTNAIVFWSRYHLLPAVILLAGLFGVCARAGRGFRTLRPAGRALVVGIVILLPFAAGAAWLRRQGNHVFVPGYLPPVIAPGAAVVVGVVSGAVARLRPDAVWLRGATAWLLLVACAWTGRDALTEAIYRHPQETWDMADVAAVAPWAIAHGWSHEQLVYRVQGPSCEEFAIAAGAEMPAPGSSLPDPGRALRILLRNGVAGAVGTESLVRTAARVGGDIVKLPGCDCLGLPVVAAHGCLRGLRCSPFRAENVSDGIGQDSVRAERRRWFLLHEQGISRPDIRAGTGQSDSLRVSTGSRRFRKPYVSGSRQHGLRLRLAHRRGRGALRGNAAPRSSGDNSFARSGSGEPDP